MGYKQHNTPKKAHIRGAKAFLDAKGLPYRKTELFSFFGVSQRGGYKILKSDTDRTRHNNPDKPETRGRKRKLSERDINSIEELYDDEGFEAKRLSWTSAALEAGVETDARDRTIGKAMSTRQLYKRIAQEVEYKNEQDCTRRLNWAKRELAKRPKPEDWHDVIFSDECHFGYSDEGKALIARKPGTRDDPSNLQETRQPAEKDLKRAHCSAGIGYDFKSDLIWYDVPSNTNGKMTQRVYIDKILEPHVKQWMEERPDMVLEEDGDSGHGPGRNNPVRAWKDHHQLQHYFNCPQSPDLSPIENCWSVPKQYIRKFPHWDTETVKGLAEEGWQQLKQKTINNWVRSMPQRLKDVIKLEGGMTAW